MFLFVSKLLVHLEIFYSFFCSFQIMRGQNKSIYMVSFMLILKIKHSYNHIMYVAIFYSSPIIKYCTYQVDLCGPSELCLLLFFLRLCSIDYVCWLVIVEVLFLLLTCIDTYVMLSIISDEMVIWF